MTNGGKMKDVVLGAAGFIGGAVLEALHRRGQDVRAIDTSSIGLRLDRDAEWLKPIFDGVDTVFLCAGRTGGVGRMSSDPFSFMYPNVRIHMNVLEAAAANGVRRVVCVQSTTGYPDSSAPMREDQYGDGDLHPAYTVPGTTWRFVGAVADMFMSKTDLEVVFFRPSNVYGPRNSFDPKFSHVIEATVRKVVERQDPFKVWGNGMDVRDAIYIDDLAEAITLGSHCPPGAYNVGTGQEMTVNEIIEVLLAHAAFHPMIEHDLSKPSAIKARRVDCRKLRALGWEPKVSMEEGLRKTHDWFAAQQGAQCLAA